MSDFLFTGVDPAASSISTGKPMFDFALQMFSSFMLGSSPSGVSTGLGRGRADEAYMRARGEAGRAQVMGTRHEAATRVRIAEIEAQTGRKATEQEKTSAGQAAAAAAASRRARDEASLASFLENIETGRTDPAKLDDATRAQIKKTAQGQAKRWTAIGTSPLASAGIMRAVSEGEKLGIHLSNYVPDMVAGAGMYDALRMTSGYAGVNVGVASNMAEMYARASRGGKDDGKLDNRFMKGLSVMESMDGLKAFAKRGMFDLSDRGLAGADSAIDTQRKSKFESDMGSLNMTVAAMRDLFGPGKSIDEMMNALEEMTAGGLQAMSNSRITALVNNVRHVATATGFAKTAIMHMVGQGAQKAVEMGLQGEVGAAAALDSTFVAGMAVSMRNGRTYWGMKDAEALSAKLTVGALAGAASPDSIALGASLVAARAAAASLGAKDTAGMTYQEAVGYVTTNGIGSASDRAALSGMGSTITAGNYSQFQALLGANAGREAGLSAGLLFQLNPDEVQGASHERRGELMMNRRASLIREVAYTQVRGDVTREQAAKAFQLYLDSDARSPEAVEALFKGRADIGGLAGAGRGSAFFTQIGTAFGQGQFTDFSSRDEAQEVLNKDVVEKSRKQMDMAAANDKFNQLMKDKGIGTNTVVDRMIDSLMADPDAERGSLKALFRGDLSEEQLKMVDVLEAEAKGRAEILAENISPEEKAAKGEQLRKDTNAQLEAIGGKDTDGKLEALAEKLKSGDEKTDIIKTIGDEVKRAADALERAFPDTAIAGASGADGSGAAAQEAGGKVLGTRSAEAVASTDSTVSNFGAIRGDLRGVGFELSTSTIFGAL